MRLNEQKKFSQETFCTQLRQFMTLSEKDHTLSE